MRGLASTLTMAAVLALSGCVSVAPPVRSVPYGAPGRMQAGMVESATEAAYGPDAAGGGSMIGYGINDDITVEGGGELFGNRAMGWLGTRWTPLRPEGRDFAFVLDVEGGLGAGVGGQRCEDDADGNPCESTFEDFRRPAGGGYFGLGIGGKIRFFSPWLRLRTQATAATGVPITSITTGLLGLQFSIASLVHIYAGSGGALVVNENITWFGWYPVSGGLSFTIPTARTTQLREQSARLRARSAQ
jgi:hypothetical protein